MMRRFVYFLATVVVSGGFLALGAMSYKTPEVGICLMIAGGCFGYLMACLMGRSKVKHHEKEKE